MFIDQITGSKPLTLEARLNKLGGLSLTHKKQFFKLQTSNCVITLIGPEPEVLIDVLCDLNLPATLLAAQANRVGDNSKNSITSGKSPARTRWPLQAKKVSPRRVVASKPPLAIAITRHITDYQAIKNPARTRTEKQCPALRRDTTTLPVPITAWLGAMAPLDEACRA